MKLYYIKNGIVRGVITGNKERGYQWCPLTTAQQRSRKWWPSPEASIKGRISGGKIVEAESLKAAIGIGKETAQSKLAADLRAISAQNGGGTDHEAIHGAMDNRLVAELRSLGYGEAMDVYDKEEKWCA